MPSERSIEEFCDWIKQVYRDNAKYATNVNSQPNWWTYDTAARSNIDGREFHVWERIHKEGHRVYALRPLLAEGNPTPPKNSCGYYASAKALFKLTGIDVRGR